MDAVTSRIDPAEWLVRFETGLGDPETADWAALFAPTGYWRDLVAFTWNIVTLEGPEAIAAMACTQAPAIAAEGFTIDPAYSAGDEAWFDFHTTTTNCKGYLKLENGRATRLLTAIVSLKDFPDPVGAHRIQGIEHKAEKKRRTWLDEREDQARSLGYTKQPYCLIVGGGQNGLALAARLKRQGVPTLVIDANAKPGDAWRKRYRTLYLHDPIFLDHFPYLPFPDHWPLYTSKDKMGDWLDIYAQAMEIDVWGSTVCTNAAFDEDSGTWQVTVERDGERLTLRPTQLVLATGLSGARYIPNFPGADSFQGLHYHAAEHHGREDVEGKNAVVIGSNNSAHDICVDLWENDAASVTMVQRSPTIVVRAQTMQGFAAEIPYAKNDIPIDMIDLMGATTSFRVKTADEIGNTAFIRQLDAPFYERLEKAGFQLSNGEDGSGFFLAYWRRAAGYYIDVGASDLIADGEVKLAQGEIAAIEPKGVRMADGQLLPADIIVYATGYRPMADFVGRLISPEVQAKVGPCWGLGSATAGDPGPWEGELRNMWKPTRQPNLWFQGGNLMQARFHSLHLALQIKARMERLPTPVYWPSVAEAREPNPA